MTLIGKEMSFSYNVCDARKKGHATRLPYSCRLKAGLAADCGQRSSKHFSNLRDSLANRRRTV